MSLTRFRMARGAIGAGVPLERILSPKTRSHRHRCRDRRTSRVRHPIQVRSVSPYVGGAPVPVAGGSYSLELPSRP
jgi:hypothetical protein